MSDLFVAVPLDVYSDPRLPPNAKLLFGRLALYAGSNGECYPAHQTLAEELGVSVRQVHSLMVTLRDAGLIRWRQRRGSNSYTITETRKKTSGLTRKKTSGEPGSKLPTKRSTSIEVLSKESDSDSDSPSAIRLGSSQPGDGGETYPETAYRTSHPKLADCLDRWRGSEAPEWVIRDCALAAGGASEAEMVAVLESRRSQGYEPHSWRYIPTILKNWSLTERRSDLPPVSKSAAPVPGLDIITNELFEPGPATAETPKATEPPVTPPLPACAECGHPPGRGIVVRNGAAGLCPACSTAPQASLPTVLPINRDLRLDPRRASRIREVLTA